VLIEKRTTNNITKTTSYTYNADGSLATITYPSGRVITYTPSGAGRTLLRFRGGEFSTGIDKFNERLLRKRSFAGPIGSSHGFLTT
jgi:YD repeat-containing protein